MVEIVHPANVHRFFPIPPHAQTGLVIGNKNHDKVYKEDFDGTVKQAYPNIRKAKEHLEKSLAFLHFFGINN